MRWASLCLALLLLIPTFAAETPATLARININFASAEMLETLPGIGPKLAGEIIAARPFRTIDELDRVKGIGPAKLAQIRGKIFIGPSASQLRPLSAAATPPTNAVVKTKINLNAASQLELEQLPGIGPKRAEAIIAGRPYKSVDELKKVKGIPAKDIQKLKDLVSVK